MKRDYSSMSRLIMAAVTALLAVAVWRHYQPLDRDRAFPAGELVVGVDASFPPFAFDDGGSLRGLDVELGEAIAGEIGLPARFVNLSFYGLYDALISGEIDLLVAALLVDPARMDDVRYSESYFDNGLVLVTAQFPVPVSLAALSGASLAFEYASGADAQVRAWESEGHTFRRMPYETPSYALDAVRLGQADAALVDAMTLHIYAREHAEWEIRREFVTHEPYAIAVRIDREEAWKLVGSALGALKERGELVRIVEKWF